MFKNLKLKLSGFFKKDVFSSFSILPFSNYRKNYSTADFLSAYEISLYTNKGVSIRAKKVGNIEFQIKDGREVIEDSEILDLLNDPSDIYTKSQFWTLYQKYLDIYGEAYLVKEREPILGGKTRINNLIILESGLVKPYFEKETGELVKIEYSTPDKTITYFSEDVIYSHNPDPRSPLRGESLIRAGVRQITTSTQIDEYQSKILENGGRVEGVFNFKTDKLTKGQLNELKDKYQEEYGNASKAGLPMFLAGDAKYERLGLDPAELAYLETKKLTLNDILILTGVPRALLGLTSEETFSNADASIRVFLQETINPLLRDLTNALNNDDDFSSTNLTIDYVDPVPENKEEKRKDIETADKTASVTLNEKREMLGLEPVSYGDVIYAPMNLMALGEEKTVEEEKKAKAKKKEHPLRDVSTRRLYHALQLKRLDRRQLKMKDVINKYFKDQEKRLVDQLKVQKHFRKKDLLGEIFVKSLEVKLAKETVLPVLNELLREAAEDSKEVAGSDWEFQETAEIESWLDKKTAVFAEQINDTTFKTLKKEFQISLDEGENRNELIKRIEATYGNISEARAETIARTEVHGVIQYGTMQGYEQANLPIKIWVWAPGTKGGVRDSHQAMDGEEQPLGNAFSNGLMFPGEGPASEVINCQCSV